MLNDPALNILLDFARKIPATIFGSERVRYVVDHYTEISYEEQMLLQQFANSILSNMLEKNASDIEIGGHGVDNFIWMRIYNDKTKQKDLPQLSADEAAILIISMLTPLQRKLLLTDKNVDFSYTFFYKPFNKSVRFRADAYFDLDHLAMNMRAITANIRPLASYEFHPMTLRNLSYKYLKFGLTLVTGITGSGKSTTLDAIIDTHNQHDPVHIVIIAWPVEFVHKSVKAIIKHREVGKDVLTFKEGVIQALRQDPDIIVVGEMRDPETILAALEVTDTGHKVFSTLHTSSAVESIDRIIAEVDTAEQERVRNRLADVLTCIISQKLVPTLDGKRVLAKEILNVTPSVKAAIKNNNTGEIYGMIAQGAAQGMVTMEQDLKRLFMQKKISVDNAIAFSNNKTLMQQLLSAV